MRATAPSNIGSLQRYAISTHKGDACSAYLGAGYNFGTGSFAVVPFANMRYIHLDEDGFTETGADSLNLAVDPRDTDSPASELGLRLARTFRVWNGSLIPEISSALSYDFDMDDRAITSAFESAPGVKFSIRGRDAAEFGAVVGAGLTFIHDGGISEVLKYSGEFRNRYNSHGVMGELRFLF